VTLQRMEKKGMVKSYVGQPTAERGGRRRRHYLIDTPGEQALGRSYRALRTMCEGLEGRLENL
jgi:PadR family transcriptional regulator PadR